MEVAPALAAALIGVGVIVAVSLLSHGGTFDVQEQGIVTDGPQTNGVAAMAQAIKRAEGSNPVYNNPGDIKLPGWKGPVFGEGIPIFPTAAEGLARLYRQLNLIVNGQSRVYSLSDTIETMAQKWTGGDKADSWALIVASILGTETGALLSEVLV